MRSPLNSVKQLSGSLLFHTSQMIHKIFNEIGLNCKGQFENYLLFHGITVRPCKVDNLTHRRDIQFLIIFPI